MGVVIAWHPLAILGWIATTACFVGAGLLFARLREEVDAVLDMLHPQPIEQGADENTDLDECLGHNGGVI